MRKKIGDGDMAAETLTVTNRLAGKLEVSTTTTLSWPDDDVEQISLRVVIENAPRDVSLQELQKLALKRASTLLSTAAS